MKFNNVFVVDDDKIYHFLIKKLFISNNIEVSPSFFENGQDALDGIKHNLDKEEVLDGWQFLEEFKKLKEFIKKEISIYVISSSDNSMDRNKAEEFDDEITNYYLKPMTSDAIKSIFAL
jgi:CheY-like chemotaxis protein